jgi:hypothetical protein
MFRITACFIGVLVMSIATLRAGPAQESLRVGDRLPILTTMTAAIATTKSATTAGLPISIDANGCGPV